MKGNSILFLVMLYNCPYAVCTSYKKAAEMRNQVIKEEGGGEDAIHGVDITTIVSDEEIEL